MNRIGAVKAVMNDMRDLIVDTIPASLTGSSIYASSFIYPNAQQLLGKNFYIYSGAGAGQERVIGSYAPATKQIIFAQVFNSMPSVNSSFLITDFFSKSDFDAAMDRLVGKARTKYLEEKVATLSIVGTQYEYAVPSGMEWISTIRLVPTANSDYANDTDVNLQFELRPRVWRIELNPSGSYVIIVDPRQVYLADYDKQWCRIEGQAKPDIAATDNATIPEDLEEYIVIGASMLLSSQRINSGREWKAKFYMFRDLFAPLEDYIYRYGRGRKVK